MSIWFTAYAAYGFPLPDEFTDEEAIGQQITELEWRAEGVGTLSAGPYDRNRLYLVTECVEADLNDGAEPIPLKPVDPNWNHALLAVAAAMRLDLAALPAPCWLLIPDQS